MTEEVIKVAETNGWRKVKWSVPSLCHADHNLNTCSPSTSRFKLHLWPHILPGQKAGHPSLPSNKRPEDILSDYLQYLYRCAITYIKKTHVNWQDLSHLFNSKDSIDFVLTYPNGWEGVQEKMRYAAILSGLISDDAAGRSHLSFVTEGEANLAFVMGHGAENMFQNVSSVCLLL